MDDEKWVLVVNDHYFVSRFKPNFVNGVYIFNSGCTHYQSITHYASGQLGHECGNDTQISPGMGSSWLLNNPDFSTGVIH